MQRAFPVLLESSLVATSLLQPSEIPTSRVLPRAERPTSDCIASPIHMPALERLCCCVHLLGDAKGYLVGKRTAASTRPQSLNWRRCFEDLAVPSQLGVEIMNARPLHDRLIVRRLEEGEQKSGGIIIPDTAKEKPQRGTVIAAGNGKVREDGKRVPLDIKAGDLIIFGKYANQEVKLDGEEYLIMREDDVLAIIDHA
jgi:chaperonin GroES